MRKPHAVVILLLLLGAVAVLWFVGGRFLYSVGFLLMRTVDAQTGVLEVAVEGEAMLLREEEVVPAPAGGTLTRLVDEGARVPANAVVAEVVPGDEGGTGPGARSQGLLVRSARPGVVSFRLDGWETAVPLERALDTDLESLRHAGAGVREVVDGGQVTQGTPLFRLVDNHRVHVLVRVREARGMTVGQQVWVRFDALVDEEFAGTIRGLRVLPEGMAVLVRIDRYVSAFTDLRWDDIRLVLRRFRGVVVPRSAVVEEGGRTGVYVRGREATVFKEVRILGQVGDAAAVDGLSPDVRVVADPRRMPGRR